MVGASHLNLTANYKFTTNKMETFLSILTSLDRRSKANEKYI